MCLYISKICNEAKYLLHLFPVSQKSLSHPSLPHFLLLILCHGANLILNCTGSQKSLLQFPIHHLFLHAFRYCWHCHNHEKHEILNLLLVFQQPIINLLLFVYVFYWICFTQLEFIVIYINVHLHILTMIDGVLW